MYNISALLFPNRCICCGKICTDRFFCKHCAGSLSVITKKLCDRCGLPVSLCCCKQNFYYFRSVISCFENDGEARQAFYRFKFGGYRPAARYFTDAMAAQVERLYDGITFDFVSAVPTHRKTVRERGYDQTRLPNSWRAGWICRFRRCCISQNSRRNSILPPVCRRGLIISGENIACGAEYRRRGKRFCW